MQRFSLPDQFQEAVVAAADTLRRGGVILYPTDTLYGLGVDALNEEAIAKVKMIKDREEQKPVQVLVRDFEMAKQYSDVTELAQSLSNNFLPGALVIVLNKKEFVPDSLSGEASGTVGIRVPNHPFCLALAKEFDKPFTTTSANRSGFETLSNVDEILEQLGDKAAYIDVVIDQGEISNRLPSTVVDARGDAIAIIRDGAIPRELVLRV